MSQHQDKRGTVNHTLLLAHMLVVLFVGLKLTAYIAWSWWMVVSPLWIYALIMLAVGFVFGFIGAYRAVNSRKDKAESV